MMVIQGELATTAHGITANTPHIFPADRCVWSQTAGPNNEGYLIGTTFFFPGDTSTATVITNARLGYIGKSGRFVEIAG